MFNIGMGEIILILLVAFVIVGPQDLPKVARFLGRNVRKLRLLLKEIKQESGWNDIEKEFKDTSNDVKQSAREVKTAAEGVGLELRHAGTVLDAEAKELRDELHPEKQNGGTNK